MLESRTSDMVPILYASNALSRFHAMTTIHVQQIHHELSTSRSCILLIHYDARTQTHYWSFSRQIVATRYHISPHPVLDPPSHVPRSDLAY